MGHSVNFSEVFHHISCAPSFAQNNCFAHHTFSRYIIYLGKVKPHFGEPPHTFHGYVPMLNFNDSRRIVMLDPFPIDVRCPTPMMMTIAKMIVMLILWWWWWVTLWWNSLQTVSSGGWQTRSDGFVGNHCLRSVLTRESPFSTVSISIASRGAAVHINPISPSALQPSVLTMLILTPASPSLPQAICLLSVCLV